MTGGVHIVGVVPPPVTGMTLVTERMATLFAQAGQSIVHPVQKSDGLRGWRWTLHKHRAVRAGLKAALAARPQAIYYVPDAGHGLWGNLLLHAALLSQAPHVILHHHVYSYVQTRNATFARFLARIAARGARVTHIALAEDMATRLRRLYGAEDVVVMGNAGFAQAATRESARPLKRVGFLSNVTREKGIEAFMEVVRTTGLEADVAGPVADSALHADLTQFVEEAPQARRLLGPVYGPQKEAFFAGIDALLFPSHYANEAQPLTIFEALSAGLPVLAAPQGAIADQLTGSDWVLDHASFAQRAADRLTGWAGDQTTYAEASAAATRLWETACASDARALEALMQDLYPAPARHTETGPMT